MVSLNDYKGTDITKGFDTTDDIKKSEAYKGNPELIVNLEKSEYQRVRNGKLEHVSNKVIKREANDKMGHKEDNMREREMKCGCSVRVPNNIDENSEEESDYLKENGHIKEKQVGESQWNAVCSHCNETLQKDI